MRLSVDTNADGLDSKYIQHSNDVGFNFELARSLIYDDHVGRGRIECESYIGIHSSYKYKVAERTQCGDLLFQGQFKFIVNDKNNPSTALNTFNPVFQLIISSKQITRDLIRNSVHSRSTLCVATYSLRNV